MKNEEARSQEPNQKEQMHRKVNFVNMCATTLESIGTSHIAGDSRQNTEGEQSDATGLQASE